MKPFNLERALAGDLVLYQGAPVTQLEVFDKGLCDKNPMIIFTVDNDKGTTDVNICRIDGTSDRAPCLHMAPKITTYWFVREKKPRTRPNGIVEYFQSNAYQGDEGKDLLLDIYESKITAGTYYLHSFEETS